MKLASASLPVLLQAPLLGTAQSTVVFSYNTTSHPAENTRPFEVDAAARRCDLTPLFRPSTYKCAAEPMTQVRICAGDELSQVTAMVMIDRSAPTCMADSFGLISSS